MRSQLLGIVARFGLLPTQQAGRAPAVALLLGPARCLVTSAPATSPVRTAAAASASGSALRGCLCRTL